MMDEFSKFEKGQDDNALASSEPASDSRLIISTYKGTDNAYYRCMNTDSNMIPIILDWKRNPTRNKDMFRIDLKRSKLLSVDNEDEILRDYAVEFFTKTVNKLIKHGYPVSDQSKIWSPWYVSRCLRVGMTPRIIAEEYDMDPGGTEARFFSKESIDLLLKSARPPSMQGDFLYHSERCEFDRFSESKAGTLKLWVKLRGKSPPPSKYVIGADIATGQGGTMSSNSVFSAVDRESGVKAAEFASPNIGPEDFARLVVSACRWFCDLDGTPAYLVFETNGPGGSFRNAILENTTFRNFYYRTSRKAVYSKPTKEPGFWSGMTEKREILSKYRWSLAEGHFVNYSELALLECLAYYELKNRKVEFVEKGIVINDPSNSGENHGDRVIADALAMLGVEQLNGSSEPLMKEQNSESYKMLDPPEDSFRWRQLKRERDDKRRQMRRHW
jgi:hypothetical protein